jgi:alpha-N-acetylglucosaminidase
MANNYIIRPYYDMKSMQTIWALFLNASNKLGAVETFRNDLVEVTRQSLQDVAFLFYLELLTAYNVTKNITHFNHIATQIMSLLYDIDEVLATQKPFLLGPWLEAAKAWGTCPLYLPVYCVTCICVCMSNFNDSISFILYSFFFCYCFIFL